VRVTEHVISLRVAHRSNYTNQVKLGWTRRIDS